MKAKKPKQVQLQKVEPNPCDNHMCGWGKECALDKKNRPICQCISKCPEVENDPNDQVCASNNQTYTSLCDFIVNDAFAKSAAVSKTNAKT